MIWLVQELLTHSHETKAKKWEAILEESFPTQPFWFMTFSLKFRFQSESALRSEAEMVSSSSEAVTRNKSHLSVWSEVAQN